MRQISTLQAALATYHALFMSKATYAILIWGASTEAKRIFLLQKEAIRALTKSGYRESCRNHFKQLGLLTLPSAYILAAIMYVHNNKDLFHTQKELHD